MGPKLRENMVSGFAEARAAREPRTTSEATMARDGEERNGSVWWNGEELFYTWAGGQKTGSTETRRQIDARAHGSAKIDSVTTLLSSLEVGIRLQATLGSDITSERVSQVAYGSCR